MKTWKLVSGILSIVLFFVVASQSRIARVVNLFDGQSSGSAGMLVSIMMLAGGIVSITTRTSIRKGGNVALAVLFGLGALVGYTMAGNYTDLNIWATWCLVNAILAVIAMR